MEQQSNAEALKQVQSTADQFDAYLDRVAVLPRAITARKEAMRGRGRQRNRSVPCPFAGQPAARRGFRRIPGKGWRHYRTRRHALGGPQQLPQGAAAKGRPARPFQGMVRRSSRTGQMYISEPYFDAGGSDAEIVSVTLPFYTAAGKFGGVAGADLSLDLIRAIVTSLRFRPDKTANANGNGIGRGKQDYSFLITRSGRIMAHPNEALSMSENFAGADVESVPGGNDIAARDSGFVRLVEKGVAATGLLGQSAAHRLESGDEHPGNGDHRFGEPTGSADCGGGGLAVLLVGHRGVDGGAAADGTGSPV